MCFSNTLGTSRLDATYWHSAQGTKVSMSSCSRNPCTPTDKLSQEIYLVQLQGKDKDKKERDWTLSGSIKVLNFRQLLDVLF